MLIDQYQYQAMAQNAAHLDQGRRRWRRLRWLYDPLVQHWLGEANAATSPSIHTTSNSSEDRKGQQEVEVPLRAPAEIKGIVKVAKRIVTLPHHIHWFEDI